MFNEKLKRALVILEKKGFKKGNYAPPLYRMLWLLKIQIPPPHFRSYNANFFSSAIFFMVAFLILRLAFSVWDFTSITRFVVVAIICGSVFGWLLAKYYHHGKKTMKLPNWNDV
ncbi:MAG: hypothetical protein HQ556_12395 [Candidatus Marinimicrobia bacterium]|nr:hypothetical protein [Candidatus Neomarinimicrobiota bacterium]